MGAHPILQSAVCWYGRIGCAPKFFCPPTPLGPLWGGLQGQPAKLYLSTIFNCFMETSSYVICYVDTLASQWQCILIGIVSVYLNIYLLCGRYDLMPQNILLSGSYFMIWISLTTATLGRGQSRHESCQASTSHQTLTQHFL